MKKRKTHKQNPMELTWGKDSVIIRDFQGFDLKPHTSFKVDDITTVINEPQGGRFCVDGTTFELLPKELCLGRMPEAAVRSTPELAAKHLRPKLCVTITMPLMGRTKMYKQFKDILEATRRLVALEKDRLGKIRAVAADKYINKAGEKRGPHFSNDISKRNRFISENYQKFRKQKYTSQEACGMTRSELVKQDYFYTPEDAKRALKDSTVRKIASINSTVR